MSILSEEINDHQDAIVRLGSWKSFNKVKRKNLPCRVGYWQWLQKPWQFSSIIFGLLTSDTSLDELSDSGLHATPGKTLLESSTGNRHTGMSTLRARVKLCNEGLLQPKISAYPHAGAVTKDAGLKGVLGNRSRIQCEFGDQLSRERIIMVTSADRRCPGWHRRGNSIANSRRLRVSRQRVSRAIC